MTVAVEPASFRDPSGYVFVRENTLYRHVAPSYAPHYKRLMESGLYQALVDQHLLIPHVEETAFSIPNAAFVLRPEPVSFISYPYEWCFGQLRDAALATLRAQSEALRFGMWLKDASAYNVQFWNGKPTLIDTLSFEEYREGSPWPAYRQYCQHFLAPLALMSRVDIRLGALLRSNIDGIPLDLASRLLPGRSRLDFGLLTHVHIHGAAQKRYESSRVGARQAEGKVSRTGLLGLIDSLETATRKLSWRPAGTEWAEYYRHTNYTGEALDAKRSLVREMLQQIQPEPHVVWDLGANTGEFSRVAASLGARVISLDVDPAAVEKNYRRCREDGEQSILPLLQDLTGPTPDLGWDLRERKSLVARGPADAVMALALIHHLAIGNNVPLDRVASFFARLGDWLIVEFVPKSDSQVEKLLASREDIFPEYTREGFESAFSLHFEIVRAAPIDGTDRTLYLMRGRPCNG